MIDYHAVDAGGAGGRAVECRSIHNIAYEERDRDAEIFLYVSGRAWLAALECLGHSSVLVPQGHSSVLVPQGHSSVLECLCDTCDS